MNLHNSSQPSFNSQSILNSERSLICDGESGHLEQLSAELIKVSGEGNFKAVCKLLETGLIDPSVSDRKGTFPLIAAATNMHIHVLNLLLDFGANVNQVFVALFVSGGKHFLLENKVLLIFNLFCFMPIIFTIF